MYWRSLAVLVFVSALAASAEAQLYITEWMYSGANGEFVEFTNMSASPVNMADWHYSDSDQGVMDLELDVFGTIQAGESVVLTEMAEATFRAAWGLAPSVKILGGNENSNLGRVDEINLYHLGVLVDRLTFGDNRDLNNPEHEPVGAPATAGSIRTQNRSGNPTSLAALGANNVFLWEFSSLTGSDQYGTYDSTDNDRGNPGSFYLAVPEPSSLVLSLLGLAGLAIRRRR